MVDESGKARITDFGLAAIARNPHSHRSTLNEDGHSARWCAPEVLNSEPVSKESDVFSFGMVIVEVGGDRSVYCQPPDLLMKVFTGGAPFGGERTPAVIAKIMTGKLPERPTHPRFTDRLWKLTQQCLGPVSSDRPCMEEVLEGLKDMVGSRGISPNRVYAQPSQRLKGDISETFSRRFVGNSPLKQQQETGEIIPHAFAAESILICWQESSRVGVVPGKGAR